MLALDIHRTRNANLSGLDACWWTLHAHSYWESTRLGAVIKELEERVISAVDSMKDKHTLQLMEHVEADIPCHMRAHVRASSLHLRRREDALGHLQRYMEAQQVCADCSGPSVMHLWGGSCVHKASGLHFFYVQHLPLLCGGCCTSKRLPLFCGSIQ
jgi:hypothetical protein